MSGLKSHTECDTGKLCPTWEGGYRSVSSLFAPMSSGFNPRSWHLCALGFQSKLAFPGISPATPVYLLHLKLDQTDLKSDQRARLESSDTH